MPYNSFTRALASSRIGAVKRAQLAIWAKEQAAEYRETGDIVFLEESVRLRQQVLEATPNGHPHRYMHLSNLGNVLTLLYRQTEDSALLADAATALREAVTLAPSGHRNRAVCLSNLGDALDLMFDQTGSLDLLEEAVQAQQDALAATSPRSPLRTTLLTSLIPGLRKLFEQTRDPDVLAEAIDATRQCLKATSQPEPLRALYLHLLGMSLGDLFEETGDLDALAESVQAHRDAVALIPTDDWQRGGFLFGLTRFGLGLSLILLYDHIGDEAVLAEARDVWIEASGAGAQLGPELQIVIHRMLGYIEAMTGDARHALAHYEKSVSVLPQLAPRKLASPDRRRQLGRVAGLAADAASIAVTAGQPERAIELLEQARGILLGEAMGARGDIADLRALDGDLAAEFDRLRAEINAADLASPDPFDYAIVPPLPESADSDEAGRTDLHEAARRITEERQRLVTEWDELLARIRDAGLDTFLLPVPIERLRAHASKGPVVFVNAGDFRCDALILTAEASNPVRVVPLAAVTGEDIARQANALDQAIEASAAGSQAERRRGQQELSRILAWLWDGVTAPVLEELGFCSTPEPHQKWPRVWWCPVGKMAVFPLHAAGYHGDIAKAASDTPRVQRRAVLDRVVSSYTPTVRALQYARQSRSNSAGGVSDGALIVAMPETPLASALPGAQVEADLVSRLIPGSQILSEADATRESVLAALPHHRIAHLSCHGISDLRNPASSRLLLQDHADSPLTVASLAALQLTDAELAFLSACSTSGTSQNLVDEAVHITAAFQLAGYQNVIGTLWPVLDEAASLITEQFYTRLTNTGAGETRSADAARILHDATRDLRNQYPHLPTVWAGFVHSGA
jgi:tetratricopeptide (TPR) repeat protein